MEHSALHAAILLGLIVAFGGPLATWLLPSVCAERIARLTAWGAFCAAGGTLLDLGVQVAEVEGRTIFGGIDLRVLREFATTTTVGQLALARTGALLLAGAAARWCPRRPWLVAIPALAALVLTSFVSHAAAQPEGRALAVAGQFLHVAAVAIWLGVLLHACAVRDVFIREPAAVATFTRRFTPLALAAVAVAFGTGVIAVLRALHSPLALFGSAYGWTLLVKLTLLLPALAAGWWNFRHARQRPAEFPRKLELETIAAILVVTAAGIVGSISPPGDDGSLTLTPTQMRALLSPDFPTSHVDDWTAPENPLGPTDDDLRYSELTHNWSGLVVIALGLCWLAQRGEGRAAWWAARAVPVVLLPFGCFIAVASNPELWLLRTVPMAEAITNPQLLEHQLGAVLVFLLAWLAWRDRHRAKYLRPLGFPLPLIMIAGSLLLLGHAHSTLSVPDELTNLINVQHAIMGACGLFAGTARLLQLRGVVPEKTAAIIWPSCVIALGVFMAFFYRELV